MEGGDPPIFTAISSSARQLFLLLRCISFVSTVEVQITSKGLRFSAEETRVVQGLAFLEKSLFSSYHFNPSVNEDARQGDSLFIPVFQISLPALLETLQIFGISEPASSYRHQNGGFTSSYTAAFNTPALALGGTCRITYAHLGAPLSIIISEPGVTTTCDLTTYEPASNFAGTDYDDFEIPFQRDNLTLKLIMRSTWLHDAMSDLSSTNPNVLVLSASSTSLPYFALDGIGGPFGDSTVDFHPDPKQASTTSVGGAKKSAPSVSETFHVSPAPGMHGRVKQRYRFELIKKAARAMALASKVSIRCDGQGVLSMQFMIEVGENASGGGQRNNDSRAAAAIGVAGVKVSFVDFRFVPLASNHDDSEDDGTEDEE